MNSMLATRRWLFVGCWLTTISCLHTFGTVRMSLAQDPQPKQEAAGDESGLDVFDDFFGKKEGQDKPADQKDAAEKDAAEKKSDEAKKEQEKKANEGEVGIAVEVQIAPAAMVAPAIRIEAGRAALNKPEADADTNPEEEDLDPSINRLSRALKLERALLRRACTLSKEQETALDAWDAKWIQAQLGTAEGKKLKRKLSVVPMGFPDVPFSVSRNVLLELIEPEVKKLVSEEQFAAYKAEVDARIAFEKQSEIDATVAIIDHHLLLSSEQRVEVEKVMSKMGSLPPEPLNYLRYGQYIPNMSFTTILKYLNKYQRKILNGLQQVQFGSSGEEDQGIIEQ